ncbi:MAG: AMP-binding protein [Candidatus Sulfotelmatobacter sp.]
MPHVSPLLRDAGIGGLQWPVLKFKNLIAALDAAPENSAFITFWVDEDQRETVTFGEFRRRARLHAAVLQEQGVASGDRLVILMPQSVAAMVSFTAAMMLGAVPAILAYPNFKVEPAKYRSGLAGVTANLSAKAVVIDPDFPDEMLDCVALGAETKLIRAGNADEGNRSVMLPDSTHIAPESLAFIQHSGGTTGLQKGVALTHAAVLRQIEHLAHALRIDPVRDRIYSWLPLYHDMGLIACFMLPMICHVPVVMQSPIDWVMQPESMLRIIAESKCTLAWMPNFAFQFVPRRTPQKRWAEYDLSSLRLLINCSEPVRASSMREFQTAFNIRSGVLQCSYAMAENVFAVTQSDIDAAAPNTLWIDGQQYRTAHRILPLSPGAQGALSVTSSGRLLPNQHVRILSDSGAIVPDDSVGEIAIQSDCLFTGYYNRPDLTAEAFLDGWYRTGDLGFLLQGELYVVGRKKDLLIVGGENIYPQDLEEIVGAHPAIHDGRAIAIGIYNPEIGTEDIVVVAEVDKLEMLAQTSEIEQQIRSSIVAVLGIAVKNIFLVPSKWIVKSTAGKPARSATREKLLQEHPELSTEPVNL